MNISADCESVGF